MLATDSQEWLRLQHRLGDLASEAGAQNAFVLDAWANLWCAAHSYDGSAAQLATLATERALASVRPPLPRGGHIDGEFFFGYIWSFAGVYVLVLRFTRTFDAEPVRVLVVKALPSIEALTLALPPPDGPGSGTSEGFGTA